MGIFSRFENKMEDAVDGAASRISKAPISPVQIAKKAEREMRRETMVGAGKEYAPTLYTVLVNADDDARLFGYYPTLAGETETYLKAKAMEDGLVMDGSPLVRFIVDQDLRHGRFDVIAETVAAPIIAQLREEEMERYGIAPKPAAPPAVAPHQHEAPPAVDATRQPAARAAHTMAYDGGTSSAPQASSRGKLIDLNDHHPYDLGHGPITLGRDSSCDITVNDIAASRKHAEFRTNPQGQWIVTDLGSTNGTMVNGETIATQPLYVGDVITIGKTDFEFTLAS